ncbi:MAG: hypothetical protein DRP71_02840 [Verrucomicrobia bacterium]|nr:MAG: hypothetical protein DRP71_02840 [Verrucomicrobiota bacterium]
MWKANWEDTKKNFIDWWNHEGLILGVWRAPETNQHVHEVCERPRDPVSIEESYASPVLRARLNHWSLSRSIFPADVLPVSDTNIGPGSLALFIGSEPGFSPDTVWFKPSIQDHPEPERLPPYRFDPSNRWWRVTEATLKACAELGRGKYLVGCPDLVENIDILAALRDPQTFLIDLVERPGWVEERVLEINQVWFAAYERIYDIIKDPNGGSAFGAFSLWGPGRTAKVQCDAAAMISPAMFNRFVVPGLTEQCEWLDNSMYHLDGTQAMCHLDALLEIEALDAIEWTPQSGIEGGGHPRWHEMYRRIVAAGKSVQTLGVRKDEVQPLLDAVGNKGIYIMPDMQDQADIDDFLDLIEPYR